MSLKNFLNVVTVLAALGFVVLGVAATARAATLYDRAPAAAPKAG
jgi:hypothetical protein